MKTEIFLGSMVLLQSTDLFSFSVRVDAYFIYVLALEPLAQTASIIVIQNKLFLELNFNTNVMALIRHSSTNKLS